jgi:FO synthase
MPPERMESAVRAIGREPRQRTTLYGAPERARVELSYGASPLAEPVNPHVNDAGLKRPPRLVRPGLTAA